MLILIGTGAYTKRVERDMTRSLSCDLLNNYRALSASQRRRESAGINNDVGITMWGCALR